MNGILYIYRDPKTNVPVYVGMSCPKPNRRGVCDPLLRARSHLKKSSCPRLGYLVQKRLSEGYTVEPQIISMGSATREEVAEAELLLIELIGTTRLKTGPLFNTRLDLGGGVEYVRTVGASDEHRANLSKALKGRPSTKKGKPVSETALSNMRAGFAKRQYTHSEERKHRISEARKAYWAAKKMSRTD